MLTGIGEGGRMKMGEGDGNEGKASPKEAGEVLGGGMREEGGSRQLKSS